MFGIGSGELLLILLIALFVLGPERMPRVARDIGRVVGDLRRTSDELREEFLNADRAINKAAEAATSQPPAQPISPTTQTAELATGTPTVDGETPFDREMREARERLRAQRET